MIAKEYPGSGPATMNQLHDSLEEHLETINLHVNRLYPTELYELINKNLNSAIGPAIRYWVDTREFKTDKDDLTGEDFDTGNNSPDSGHYTVLYNLVKFSLGQTPEENTDQREKLTVELDGLNKRRLALLGDEIKSKIEAAKGHKPKPFTR